MPRRSVRGASTFLGKDPPWARLLGVLESHYPSPGNGRPPLGLERMLRIYFPQQWFNVSDPQAEQRIDVALCRH